MCGSVFIASWQISDAGLLNMSGLDNYLMLLFQEFGFREGNNNSQLPALNGDGIFPQLATIIARRVIQDDDDDNGTSSRINAIMSSARQNIEHLFGLHETIFKLFSQPQQFKLLLSGEEVSKLIINSFLLLNCYNCFNESSNTFILRAPTIEEYLPLDEILDPPPESVHPNDMGNLYNYSTRHNSCY